MNTRSKVVYIIGQLGMGGTERQLLELIRNLDRLEFEPLIVSFSSNDALKDELQKVGCKVNVLDREKYGRIITLWHLFRLMQMYRPDIIHMYAYASRAGIPVAKILSIHRTVVSIRTDPYWQMSLLDRLMLHQATVVLANSEKSAATLRSLGKVSESKLRVIYNGIDLRQFDLCTQESVAPPIPVNADLADQTKVLAAVARVESVKSLDNLIRAFAFLQQKQPDSQLWLIGDGPARAELESLAKSLGIAGRVVFWGTRYDVPTLLKYVKVGVLSSKVEGFSNTLMEYMAARLPVIATDVGGNSELVRHGQSGLLVPYGQIESMANSMSFLLENPIVAHQMGCHGRERIEEEFGIFKMVNATESLYRELLIGGSRP